MKAAVLQREEEIRKEFAASGKKFLGEKKVLAQSIHGKPDNREPRREQEPHIACRDKWRRIAALKERQQFLRDYRAALKEFWERMKRRSADALEVVFPRGTYQMCERYGVRCVGPPAFS